MKLFLVGFMGSGKTHWGRRLAQKLQLPFIDLDQKIEEVEAKSINALFEESGETYFRKRETEVLHQITDTHNAFIMATGGGTPCFNGAMAYMKNAGTVLWLNGSADAIYNRLSHERSHRPLVKNTTPDALLLYIKEKITERKPFYRQAHITLQGDALNLETILSHIAHQ